MRAILDYLAAKRIFAVRMNSGTQVRVDGGKRRAIHMNAPGTADVLAFPSKQRGVDDKGNWCDFLEITPTWIEVKSAKGKQSELQKSFQAKVESEGHRYILVRSI